jgi:hypothetical protein
MWNLYELSPANQKKKALGPLGRFNILFLTYWLS